MTPDDLKQGSSDGEAELWALGPRVAQRLAWRVPFTLPFRRPPECGSAKYLRGFADRLQFLHDAGQEAFRVAEEH